MHAKVYSSCVAAAAGYAAAGYAAASTIATCYDDHLMLSKLLLAIDLVHYL